MDNEAWTPGPWEVVRHARSSGDFFYVKTKAILADRIPSETDARLIAAAPEMATFIEWYVQVVDPEDAEAKRLLARIKGETS